MSPQHPNLEGLFLNQHQKCRRLGREHEIGMRDDLILNSSRAERDRQCLEKDATAFEIADKLDGGTKDG